MQPGTADNIRNIPKAGEAYTYSLKDAELLTGVFVRTLHYWISKELFIPSVHISKGPGDSNLLSYADLERIVILNASRRIMSPEDYQLELQLRSMKREGPSSGVLDAVAYWMKLNGVPRQRYLLAGKEMVATADTAEEVVEILKRGDNLAKAEVMIRPPEVLQELEARIGQPEE